MTVRRTLKISNEKVSLVTTVKNNENHANKTHKVQNISIIGSEEIT